MSSEDMSPEEMQARVLYRDGLMLVIDKPAGQAVHPGPKGGPSLVDYFDALRFGLPRPPALAHRLDRDTSGCLVLGRHRKALAHLGVLFKHGRVGKTYWAVVEGGPDADEGRIDLPLGRLDATRGWWMKPDPKGQPAVTVWRVLGRALHPSPAGGGSPRSGGVGGAGVSEDKPPPGAFGATLPLRGRDALTWLALEPLTGRTHQLRVHCAAMGWPVVGDAIYGNAPRTGGPPLHLHAREVVVPLYPKRDPIAVVAPVPHHMRDALAACGWEGEAAPARSPDAAVSKAAP
ncbi:MAG TPA: RNA pseudouridine synthase [Xanthobacteraceae bacterium]|nr:RNA pseudouridine synthase [Xanthobacteraceae bacterium]